MIQFHYNFLFKKLKLCLIHVILINNNQDLFIFIILNKITLT